MNHQLQMEDAIRQNTVFNNTLLTKIADAITRATDNNLGHLGLSALATHVQVMLDTLPDKVNIFNQIRPDNDFSIEPYFGSLIGKSDKIVDDANEIMDRLSTPPTQQEILDFDNINILAENIVTDETVAFISAMNTIEIQNYAMELNGLIQDPAGAFIMGSVGGPQVQEALTEEKEEFFSRYGFTDIEEPDDGSGGDEDRPCCE